MADKSYTAELRSVFVNEAQEHLQKLNANLLAFEKDPQERALLDEMMRSLHTIKGSSAAMGYTSLSSFAHRMEDIFDAARKTVSVNIPPKTMDLLFAAFDTLGSSLASVRASGEEIDLSSEAAAFTAARHVATDTQDDASESGRSAPRAGHVEENGGMEEMTHIKVPIERLDVMMNIMEELIGANLKLEAHTALHPTLHEHVDRLTALISQMQYAVTQARLVSLKQAFMRFPRLVRDLSKERGKEIVVEMNGEEMELDRTIVDRIAEPITHLVRNAIEHGIVKKGVIRLKALREKDHAFVIVEDDGAGIQWDEIITAAEKKGLCAGGVCGVLREALHNAAEKGVVPKEVERLLYAGTLSTKSAVTELAGRGVGVSAVKEFTDALSGRLSVESPIEGGGTRFIMEVPLSLAAIRVLLVETSGDIFAIPLTEVDRIVVVPVEEVQSGADQDIAIIEGEDVPLFSLAGVLTGNIARAGRLADTGGGIATGAHLVVVVRHRTMRVGVAVDRVVAEREVGIKPLPSLLRSAAACSGSTILGDGRAALILDTGALFEMVR